MRLFVTLIVILATGISIHLLAHAFVNLQPLDEAVTSLFYFLCKAAPLFLLAVIVSVVLIIYFEERNLKGALKRLFMSHGRGILLSIWTEIRDIRRRYNEQWETVEFWLLLLIVLLQFFDLAYPAERLDHLALLAAFILAIIKRVSIAIIHQLVIRRDHVGITKFRKDALLKWLSVPLPFKQVRFAKFEGDDAFESGSLIKKYSRLLDRIVDREEAEEPFTSEDRAELYRRWLLSNQPVLSVFVDVNDEPLAAAVVLPLTRAAYEQYKARKLDALDIQPYHIVDVNEKSCRYLLVDAVATLKSDARLTGTRLTLYHCSQFYNPVTPPIVLFSTTSRKMKDIFATFGFSVSESPWLMGSTDFLLECDFSVANRGDQSSADLRGIILSLIPSYQSAAGSAQRT
ncbi:hypothetical protein [Bradyrhizobium sp.]|jgi:hypothetical protein|uniref:hypothetical protein n=1 Tax=Bradyrhizobium sp. TaxID=376 RepID=UPI003C265BD9